MRLNGLITAVLTSFVVSACVHKGTNPADPYESFNRSVYNFNAAVDATLIKPPAKLYYTVVPALVRKGVNNAFNNLDMLPSIANDLLQAEGIWAIKDSWRFLINSSLGVAGIFDVAVQFGLPPHYNDLGITFAKWGDKHSPYLVIPLIGPSTFRDGTGLLFQFALWSPYVYINNSNLAYGLLGLRYLDLRTQLFDAERLMGEALDKYAFMRDAYLQHRNYLIAGTEQEDNSLYIADSEADEAALQGNVNTAVPSDYVEE